MGNRLSWLNHLFLRNKGAKLLAVTLAVICWYAVRAVINFETVVTDVPVNVRVDDGWAVMDRSLKTADVTFRGSQEDIAALKQEQVAITLDIRGQAFKGSSTFPLKADMVQAPGGVRPRRVHPDAITLRFDPEGEKQIPVKADTQGNLPEGYEVERVVCTPATVRVYGPTQRLNELEALHTVPIDLEGRITTFKKTRVAVQPASDTWAARTDPASVAVELFIAEHTTTQEVTEVPVMVLTKSGTALRATVAPERVTVTLGGKGDLLKKLGNIHLDAYVQCADLKAGAEYDLPVHAVPPPDTTIQQITPRTVKVSLFDH